MKSCILERVLRKYFKDDTIRIIYIYEIIDDSIVRFYRQETNRSLESRSQSSSSFLFLVVVFVADFSLPRSGMEIPRRERQNGTINNFNYYSASIR